MLSHAVISLLLPSITAAAGWELEDLGDPPDGYSHPTPRVLNDRGLVVGEIYVEGDFWYRVFVWDGGRWTILPTLGGRWAWPGGVNERGQVVGTAETDELAECWEWGEGQFECDYFSRGFLWDGGVMRDLGPVGGYNDASAVNAASWVAGWAQTATGSFAVRWGARDALDVFGTFGGQCRSSFARAINNRGHVVGGATTDAGTHAFHWDPRQGLTDLGTLGGPSSWATAINDHGVVVGTSDTDVVIDCVTNEWGTWCRYEDEPFVWDGGIMTPLATLGGVSASAWGLNDRGVIVGSSETEQIFACHESTVEGSYCIRYYHAVVWQDGELIDLGVPGQWSSASDINNRGDIVGFYGSRPVIWRAVP